MEVQINNSYLQNFISKYSHQSETKVVKYLAILGLHFLEKNSKDDISLNELKAFASKRHQVFFVMLYRKRYEASNQAK